MAAEVPLAQGPSHGRVVKNASIYFLAQIVSWSMAILGVSVVPRILGEAAIGRLAIAVSITGLVTEFVNGGIETYLIQQSGQNRSQTEGLLNPTLGLRIVLIAPATAAVLVILAWIHADHALWTLGIISIVAQYPNFLMTPMRSALAGWEQASRVSMLDFLCACAFVPALPFLAFGPTVLVFSNMLIFTIDLLLASTWLRRTISVRPMFELARWKQVALGGRPYLANAVIMQVYTFSTLLILRVFTHNEAIVGVWSQAGRLCGTFLFLPTALGAALLPSMARLADSDPEELQQVQARVLCLLIVLSLPIAMMVFVLAEPLCALLYGHHRFLALPAVLHVTAFTIIPLYVVTTMYQFLVARNKGGAWSFFMIGTVVVNALASALLVPITAHGRLHNGAIGAALALLLAETTGAGCALWLLKTNPFTRETTGRIGKAIFATAVMGATAWLLRHYFIVAPAALGTAVFVVLAWKMHILTPDEEAKIVGTVRRKLGRT